MRRIKNFALGVINAAIRVIILAVIVVYVYKTALTAYDFGYRIFAEEPMGYGKGTDITVTIPMGKSVKQTGRILVDYGLIRDENLFYVQELISAYHGKLQPGTYELNTTMNAEQIMAVMASDDKEDEEEDGK